MTKEDKDRIRRAEEIQLYTENRCQALEKENEELKEKVADLTAEREHHLNIMKGLNERIEKMKICFNCKHIDIFENLICVRCNNRSKWELSE